MKVERQIRRHIDVRGLFMRQHDVQPDRLPPRLIRPPVARLHHPRPATRANHPVPAIGQQAPLRHHLRKPPRLVIKRGQRRQPRRRPLHRLGRRYPRTPKQNDSRRYPPLIQNHLRLQQFQLQPHRPQLLAHHEIGIDKRQLIGRRPGLRRVRNAPRRRHVLAAVTKRMWAGVVFGHGALVVVKQAPDL